MMFVIFMMSKEFSEFFCKEVSAEEKKRRKVVDAMLYHEETLQERVVPLTPEAEIKSLSALREYIETGTLREI